MRRRILGLLAPFCLAACFTAGEGGDQPALEGEWEDTVVFTGSDIMKTFVNVEFGPGNSFAHRIVDFEKDSLGIWRAGGESQTIGAGNTYTLIGSDPSYVKVDYLMRGGEYEVAVQEVFRWKVSGDTLELAKAFILSGPAKGIHGKWRGILDSTKVLGLVEKLMYSFEITQGGRFVSPERRDTLDVAVTDSTLTLQDSLLGPIRFDFHLAGGRLYLDRPGSWIALGKAIR